MCECSRIMSMSNGKGKGIRFKETVVNSKNRTGKYTPTKTRKNLGLHRKFISPILEHKRISKLEHYTRKIKELESQIKISKAKLQSNILTNETNKNKLKKGINALEERLDLYKSKQDSAPKNAISEHNLFKYSNNESNTETEQLDNETQNNGVNANGPAPNAGGRRRTRNHKKRSTQRRR